MDSKELFRQFWAVGDESVWGDETKRMWKVWQAAWNARQPEVVSRDAIHRVVGDIVDGEEMWSAYDIASAIHDLLTRADLAPTVGYSREQMREAMVQCVVSDDKIDDILEALTPAAQPNNSWLDKIIADDSLPPNHAVIDGKLVCYSRDPAKLVEALERIVEGFFDEPARVVAREALVAWKGGLNE